MMQFYGDQLIQIKGKICAIDGEFFKIHFIGSNKDIFVPKYLIKHQIKPKFDEIQVIRIPSWFLKKNRIISIL